MPKQQKIWNSPIFLWTVYILFKAGKGMFEVISAAYKRIRPTRFWDRKFRKWDW